MRYPTALQPGDRVCILSPAGKIDEELVILAAKTLTDWGLKPVIAPHAADGFGRFASPKENRLDDFRNALLDPSIKAIFCSRGGYGAIHLLGDIPLEMIRENAKWLIGYSDITLLHALFTKAGVVSLHAPMVKQLAESPHDQVTNMIREIVFGGIPRYQLESHPLNKEGLVTGKVVGGNLAVIAGLRGTFYDFDYTDAILFIEDIGESPYKIDRMLYNLKLGGVFDRIAGLIVGQFSDCPEDPEMKTTIYENIRHITQRYDFPVCFGFPCGHVDLNVPLPEGRYATLHVDTNQVTLRYVE
ncbi:MAG: S66 peptidase family protein [Bacteroidales bacterium]